VFCLLHRIILIGLHLPHTKAIHSKLFDLYWWIEVETLITARQYWTNYAFFNDNLITLWFLTKCCLLVSVSIDNTSSVIETWSTGFFVCVAIKLKTSFNKQYFNVILQNVVPTFQMVSGLHIIFALAQSTILKTAYSHSRNLSY